jgi:F-type H+-transporting ATPase subunit b
MLPQFDISTYPSQVFWLVVVFFTLLVMVSKFISPAAEKIFSSRQDKIDEATNLAETITKKAMELNSRYEKEISDVMQQAEEIQKEAAISLDRLFEAKRTKLTHELSGHLKVAISEIETSKDLFKNNLEQASIEVAATIINKITAKEPDLAALKQCYNKIK